AFIVSHFHCDPVWTNTQSGEILRSLAIVNQQLEYAAKEPRFKFILSEIDYLKPYWDLLPSKRGEIKKLEKDGRIEFTGGYSEPDEAEVGGEALLRNMLYGKILKEAYFDTNVMTDAQHDVFGHAVQMPQLLKGTGHSYAQFSRGNLTDLPTEFLWLSPDGSSILTKQIGYGGSASDASFLARDPKQYGLTSNSMFMSGGDFQEPDRTIGNRLKKSKTFDVVSGTHIDFFKAVEKELSEKGETAPMISRDHTPLLVGCYTSRIDTKFANRNLENLLADAEKFSTIDSMKTGAPYPWAELDFAWRQLLYGQHHDGLTGSDNENVNLDLLGSWRQATIVAKRKRDGALVHIASNIDTSSAAGNNVAAAPIVIFNSMNWKRTGIVEVTLKLQNPAKAFSIVDPEGKSAEFQMADSIVNLPISSAKLLLLAKDVPSMGYKVYRVVKADKFAKGVIPAFENGTSFENDLYKLEIDPGKGGGLKSIYSKKLKREFINAEVGVGNEIYAIKENGEKVESPWSLHTTGQFWRTGDYPAGSVKIERGAIRTRIIITNSPHKANVKILDGGDKLVDTRMEEVLPEIVQEIDLIKSSPRIEFSTRLIGYKAENFLFKAGFPAAIDNAAPLFEERFATVGRERNTERFLFYDFWREPGLKLGREYPTNNWAGLSPTTSFDFTNEAGAAMEQYPLYLG
ncbi:MAG TPA: glycoside hydrolase family 38 C-terminal domain-containing protein, partial [bacterium]|nr:glycoside hydrolase family 38 C-terminal domain-containing protein [bacterium]